MALRKDKKKSSPMQPVHTFLLHAIVIVLVLWGLFCFIFGITTAPGNDMSPNIKSGDLLFYYCLDKNVKAQDVVVLNKNDTEYVGRVVASGGDTVDITDSGNLVINGNIVVETNIYTSTPRYEGFIIYPVTLSEGEYFILADYRAGGEDSRYYGVVYEKEILGTVITVIRRNNF